MRNGNRTYSERLRWLITTLVQRRKDLGLVQMDIDDRLGVTGGLCAKWEGGFRTPTVFNLHCWCETLGLVWLLAPGAEINDVDRRSRPRPQRRRR